jgi:hypothetical protein
MANIDFGRSIAVRHILRGKGKTNAANVLLVLLVLFLLGALPTWPYSANWGYYPTGGVGLLLIIVIILIVADVL